MIKGPTRCLTKLIELSRARWKHVEDDYCDDISAILVMWNQNGKATQTGPVEHSAVLFNTSICPDPPERKSKAESP